MKKKAKGYNFKLREERAKTVVALHDFPLRIRTKPTNHKQYCYACRELMEKGQPQIMMKSGMWVMSEKTQFSKRSFTTVHINKMTGISSRRIFPRNIYLHNHCFSCLAKKMFATAGLSLNADCESCKDRFNCYTGNLEEEGKYSTYIPSRPCKVGGEYWYGRTYN